MTLKCQKQGHEIYIEKHEKNGKESLLLEKKLGTVGVVRKAFTEKTG